MRRSVTVRPETWQLRRPFVSAYGMLTTVDTVLVTIRQDGAEGRGEGRPFRPYGATTQSIMAEITSIVSELESGIGRDELNELLPPGSARNAIDCALWDLESKLSGIPVWSLAGLPTPGPITPIFGITAVAPDTAARFAKEGSHYPWFKIKLSGIQDIERVAAVHANAPSASIVVDANCSWNREDYDNLVPALERLNVVMIEQPFPSNADEALRDLPRPVALCADESCRDLLSLERLSGLYEVISIKLDKAGGLTEALRMCERAKDDGFGVMVSCMISTSLGLAPAVLLANAADYPDLGGAIELVDDHQPALAFKGEKIYPPLPELWG